MKKITLVIAIMMGVMLVTAFPACAETLTTADGVLSIEAPADNWAEVTDPNHWFVITDGKNTITAEHLSNGENLPATEIAGSSYPAVYQAFVSTKDEVFVLKGQAATEEELATVMEAIGTVKVLKYGTKTAIPKETEAAAASEFGLRLINATYYVTTDELNVRNGCSTDDAVVGTLYYGNAVTVNGAVTRGGSDYGWYQVQYNGGAAYVSAGFLSDTKPAEKAASKDTGTGKKSVGSGFSVYREDGSYVGELVPYDDGHYYINEVPYDSNGDGSFYGGAGAGMTVYTYDAWDKLFNVSDLVQCEYCGEWFHAGNDYRNHVMAAHGSSYEEEEIHCDICGEAFSSWEDYHAHVSAVHGGECQRTGACAV